MNHSVNAVYIKGLRANGAYVREVFVGRGEFVKLIDFILKEGRDFDLAMVGYDSPVLMPVVKLFFPKKVIYNALCSVYERLIISRRLAGKYSAKGIYYWLSDFIAVHLANLIMVETNKQKDFFQRMFRVSDKKLFRAWTSVDSDCFYHDSGVKKYDTFTVLFRGTFIPESGVEYAVKAAKILENQNINFVIMGGGPGAKKVEELINNLQPKKLEYISSYLGIDELREKMQKCHLSLGQLSGHERLLRTIPHKAYESLALGLPYLTANNAGIKELLDPEETCFICQQNDENSLAQKIEWISKNPDALEIVAQNGHKLYEEKLTSRLLAEELLKSIKLL